MNSTKIWNHRLAAYAKPSTRRSIAQLVITLAGFMLAIGLARLAFTLSWALALPEICLAGMLVVRLFIVQHDCGHRSFLASSGACDWIGRSLSVLTLTPYDFWRRDHDRHHANSGNLDRRGFGEINTLTVTEFKALGRWAQIRYRIYRSPIVLFGIGPAWQFLIRYRLPIRLYSKTAASGRRSIWLTNLGLTVFFGLLGQVFGYWALAVLWVPTMLVAATVGIWLFYVQHAFERTYWESSADWDFVDAALRGCSYYRLPRWLDWLTGSVGYHHVHHLSSRIPNYNLAQAVAEVPELQEAPSFGIGESLRNARLGLWCEQRKRLVSFAEA